MRIFRFGREPFFALFFWGFVCLAGADLLGGAFAPPEEWGGSGAPGYSSPSPRVGAAVADFKLKDINGKEVGLKETLASHPVVLLDFWATWCGPCVEEMPALQRLHEEFGSKGLRILTVDGYETASAVQRFVKEHKLTFTFLLDPERRISRRFMRSGIPHTLILDSSAKIVVDEEGYGPSFEGRWRDQIRRMLEAAAAQKTADRST